MGPVFLLCSVIIGDQGMFGGALTVTALWVTVAANWGQGAASRVFHESRLFGVERLKWR